MVEDHRGDDFLTSPCSGWERSCSFRDMLLLYYTVYWPALQVVEASSLCFVSILFRSPRCAAHETLPFTSLDNQHVSVIRFLHTVISD